MIFFSHKFGQLGNRLFAFGHLIANAAANGIKVVNLSFDEYSNFFEGSRKAITQYPASELDGSSNLRSLFWQLNRGTLKFLSVLKWTQSPIHQVFVADLPEFKLSDNRHFDLNNEEFQLQVKTKPVIFLFGRCFRDYENFEKFKGAIRKYFTPIPAIQKNIDHILINARQNADILIGVHIRRGDYAEFKKGIYLYTAAEYANQMKLLSERFPGKRVGFLVCSNEILDPATFAHCNFTMGSGHPVEDMYALAGCDFVMGPPSTFSRWASFYGDRPLCEIKDMSQDVTPLDFYRLPPYLLYNF